MFNKYCTVFVTSDKPKTVKKITDSLIKNRLAACVSLVNGINSVYHWKGKVTRSKEILMIIKTKKSLLKNLVKQVKELHDYEVPEITALDIIGGNPEYMEWIKKETKNGAEL